MSLHYGTKIQVPGISQKITSLKKCDVAFGYGQDGFFFPSTILDRISMGKKPLWFIKTERKKAGHFAEDTRIMTENGFTPLGEIDIKSTTLLTGPSSRSEWIESVANGLVAGSKYCNKWCEETSLYEDKIVSMTTSVFDWNGDGYTIQLVMKSTDNFMLSNGLIIGDDGEYERN